MIHDVLFEFTHPTLGQVRLCVDKETNGVFVTVRDGWMFASSNGENNNTKFGYVVSEPFIDHTGGVTT